LIYPPNRYNISRRSSDFGILYRRGNVPKLSHEMKIFNMLQLKHAFSLELKGIKHSRGSVYAYVKKRFHLRGNRNSVYTQFCELVEKEKGL